MSSQLKEKFDKFLQVARERDIFKKQYIKAQINYENKIKELSILKELSDTLRSTDFFDKHMLFWEQLKIITRYTGIETIHIMLFDEQLHALEVVASSDFQGPVHSPIYLPLEVGVPGQAIIRQEAILINDVVKCCPPEERELIQGESVLSVPLMHNGKAIGVLALVHRMKHGFSHNDVNFFRLVADRMVVTVVLSHFYMDLRKEEGRRFLLSRFFSKTVTDKILESEGDVQLGGERRHVTIIFADLHGFTSISERLDQEKVVKILNTFFSTMTPIVFKYNGTIDKLIGDGMMAIFGAPLSHEDDAFHAVQVAVEMMLELQVIKIQCGNMGWPELKMSIGVNAGEVVAGYIGSEDHLNYTVIGDAVNTAQRLQSIAGPNEIIVSKVVIDQIRDRISKIDGLKNVVELPPRMVKGKGKKVEICRIELHGGFMQ
jgi:class 3 adenylate cyclase/putative methionine-R-sulfoxide reductase with GAF domain